MNEQQELERYNEELRQQYEHEERENEHYQQQEKTMNGFTKTELEDINFALETVYLGNSDLRKKIQYMIDKYKDKDDE